MIDKNLSQFANWQKKCRFANWQKKCRFANLPSIRGAKTLELAHMSYQVKSIQKRLLKSKNRIKLTKPSPFKPKKRCLKKDKR